MEDILRLPVPLFKKMILERRQYNYLLVDTQQKISANSSIDSNTEYLPAIAINIDDTDTKFKFDLDLMSDIITAAPIQQIDDKLNLSLNSISNTCTILPTSVMFEDFSALGIIMHTPRNYKFSVGTLDSTLNLIATYNFCTPLSVYAGDTFNSYLSVIYNLREPLPVHVNAEFNSNLAANYNLCQAIPLYAVFGSTNQLNEIIRLAKGCGLSVGTVYNNLDLNTTVRLVTLRPLDLTIIQNNLSLISTIETDANLLDTFSKFKEELVAKINVRTRNLIYLKSSTNIGENNFKATISTTMNMLNIISTILEIFEPKAHIEILTNLEHVQADILSELTNTTNINRLIASVLKSIKYESTLTMSGYIALARWARLHDYDQQCSLAMMSKNDDVLKYLYYFDDNYYKGE